MILGVVKYISLDFGTDLNDCTSVDVIYYTLGSLYTSSMTNVPNGVIYAFSLEVLRLGSTGFTQRLISYDDVYVRHKDGIWSQWSKLTRTSV